MTLTRKSTTALIKKLAGVAVTMAALAAISGCAHQNATVSFAQSMSAHHAQAVEMATLALTRMDPTADKDLWAVSTDIVLTQTNQIGRMQALLEFDGQPLVASPEHGHETTEMAGMATPEDIASLGSLPKEQALTKYVDLMIAHHQGGVVMAEEALESGLAPAMERLAQAIITAQNGETETLESIRTQYR